MLDRLPAAQRVKYVRCLRQRRDEQYWRRLWQQTLGAGRVLRGLDGQAVAEEVEPALKTCYSTEKCL